MARRAKIPTLPDDIVDSILLELPVKSLLRFKRICKSWCRSIDDPEFVKSHLHKSFVDTNRQKILFISFEKFKPLGFTAKIRSTETSLGVDSKFTLLDPPIPGFLNDTYLGLKVSLCNGLVFLKNYTSMMLWNPAIRKYKLIPSYDMPPLCWTYSLFGIAYDSVAEDYMIVHVKVTDEINRDHIIEIYSVINQSWRRMEDIRVPVGFRSIYQHPVSLNGTINLIATSTRDKSECFVISFYLADEKFIVTPFPRKDWKFFSWRLRTFANRVCISATFEEKFSMWALEKDGKTGLLTWNNITAILASDSSIHKFPGGLLDFICVKENGNILWRYCNDEKGHFIEYDVRRKEVTEFKLELEILLNRHLPLLHVESLVSSKWD
ncbi:F-box protein CPR1-like [Lycium ferocissimum]|uniref:F-box protein CPR1-like n=1 Tax=Lycium ferocissimum TaxID=112874 RepID=UPI002814DE03|nr:F-box protein CPR1-like [Lycium ferocissimum]